MPNKFIPLLFYFLSKNIGYHRSSLDKILKNEKEVNYKDEEISEDFIDYIPSYIDNRCKDYESLKKYLEHKNFEEIRKICHKVLGTAESYGLKKLADIMFEIQSAARKEDLESTKQVTYEMYIYLNPSD